MGPNHNELKPASWRAHAVSSPATLEIGFHCALLSLFSYCAYPSMLGVSVGAGVLATCLGLPVQARWKRAIALTAVQAAVAIAFWGREAGLLSGFVICAFVCGSGCAVAFLPSPISSGWSALIVSMSTASSFFPSPGREKPIYVFLWLVVGLLVGTLVIVRDKRCGKMGGQISGSMPEQRTDLDVRLEIIEAKGSSGTFIP